MTPQERQLVDELFDRLAALENAPRDPDAERTIAEGLGRAPHALYALVQTAIVQDEALKRANARIAELEGQPDEPPRQGGFLDNMRETLFGRDERRGSVPNVRQAPAGAPVWGGAPAGPSAYGQPAMAQPIGSGGSFLGTAAASAAGVIGGAMLLNGIRSMFGHSAAAAGAYDPGAAPGLTGSPWGGSAADSDLARQAGIDHIGSDRVAERDDSDRAGFFGGNDDQNDDGSYGDDDPGDDSDLAGDFGDSDVDNA
jgi:uncharacterized protein